LAVGPKAVCEAVCSEEVSASESCGANARRSSCVEVEAVNPCVAMHTNQTNLRCDCECRMPEKTVATLEPLRFVEKKELPVADDFIKYPIIAQDIRKSDADLRTTPYITDVITTTVLRI
jgi:hypothetical protein